VALSPNATVSGPPLSGLARRIDKGVRAYSVEDPAGLSVVLREVFQ